MRRCARVFSKYTSEETAGQGMGLLAKLRMRADLSYYIPRMEMLMAAERHIRREHARTGGEADAPARRLPLVPDNICAGCTGYYQAYYCRGQLRLTILFCVVCHHLYHACASGRPEGLAARILGPMFRQRSARVRAAAATLLPPSGRLAMPNEFGNPCACEEDCNAPYEAEVQQDWNGRCAVWGWPAGDWRRGGLS